MINCEESSCEKFPSAICLHCMHRLCIYHIEDHQKILSNEVNELKNQVNQVNFILMNASKVMVEERKTDEEKLKHWRKQKISEIEQEFRQTRNSIKNRQKTLEQLELELNKRLEVEIQEPLKHMSIQQSTNPHLIDTIQLAIETIKQDSHFLIWNSQDSNNIINSNTFNEDKKKTISSKLSKQKKIPSWKPRNLLCLLFRDVGRTSTDRINEFIQTMMIDENKIENNGLITLIFSYLETWHNVKIERGKHKQLILNKHIITIKQYIIGKDCERKVLIALEYFFNKLKHKETTEIEMMTMLLQLFLNHQCISIPEIIDWYLNDNFVSKTTGKNLDKKWAEPFMNLHGYQIKSPNLQLNEVTNTVSNLSETLLINTQNDSQLKTIKHVRIRKPFKKLVNLFRDQSDTNDKSIHEYIEMQYRKKIDYRVIMIVRSYLKAWNECELENKNEFLLKNLFIIEYYKYDPDFEMQILFAIEIFLSQNKQKENLSIEIISTLFQLFIDQNLIKKETILKWNFDGHLYNEIYYKQTKLFAQSFIQSLMTFN